MTNHLINRGSSEHGYFFREKLGCYYATLCGSLIILLTVVMVVFITMKGLAAFTGKHPLSVLEFLGSSHWQPDDTVPHFGALNFILGSVSVSGLAVLLSAPLAIAAAILIAIIAPGPGEYFFRPVLEMFTGIPSVVYGWVGLSLLVPWIRIHFGGLGFSLLAGSLVLALMILPTITTLATDALVALPDSYREGSYALGATRWQTIYRILIPAARSRILIGVTLGITRAFGEALAVQMVIGNTIRIPDSLLNPMCTLTSIITMDMGNTVMGSAWNNALWSMALLLLLITFGLILLIKKLGNQDLEGNNSHA
ncbi:MAG TPA: phosphate ABC transporter permease subunit PstC [Firmicutes bacterium]|nr:phosphate ABC transporter permease subunit PstC [Bacillota bacterium]